MFLVKAGGGDDRNVVRHRVRSESTPRRRNRPPLRAKAKVANVRIQKCELCQILARRWRRGNPVSVTFHTVCLIYDVLELLNFNCAARSKQALTVAVFMSFVVRKHIS
jgi:hypothetical protein